MSANNPYQAPQFAPDEPTLAEYGDMPPIKPSRSENFGIGLVLSAGGVTVLIISLYYRSRSLDFQIWPLSGGELAALITLLAGVVFMATSMQSRSGTEPD